MDRNREVRRASAANGLSRRQHRITSLRDSPDRDGQKEFQETARLRDRDRLHKKERERDRDRDREILNRKKGRRGDTYDKYCYVQGSNRDSKVEESTDEESFDNHKEEDYNREEEDDRVPRWRPSNQASPSSSSMSNQSRRRGLPSDKLERSSPVLRVADEVIGVPVPRKARTASAKRSHEYCGSGGSGIGEDRSHHKALRSPASWSAEGVSPRPATVPVRKKLKTIGPKTRISKVSHKVSSTASQDIEIEVAEALYNLMKQSNSELQSLSQSLSTNMQERTFTENTNEKPDSTSPVRADGIPICCTIGSVKTVSQTVNLLEENSSLPLPIAGSVEKIAEETNEGEGVAVIRADSKQPMEVETEKSSPMLEKTSDESVAAASLQSQEEGAGKEEEDSKHVTRESGNVDGAVTMEEEPAPKEESPPHAKLDADNAADPTAIKEFLRNPAAAKREVKFEIDLMAPPMASSPGRDGVIEDFVFDPEIMAQNIEMKETVAEAKKREKQTAKENVAKQEISKLNLEKPAQDGVGISCNSKSQQQGRKQQNQFKFPVVEGENIVQSGSLPSPLAMADWPGNPPHLGYMAPLQTVIPMDSSTSSCSALQPPQFLLSQPQSKKCATHEYIARNIYYHQQLIKMNHVFPAAAGTPSLSGAKPYNLNVVQSAQNMTIGNPLQGGGQSLATTTGLIGKDKSSEVANILDASQSKQQVLQQAPQSVAAGNLLHGPAFMFPLSQRQAAGAAKANHSMPPKSATSVSSSCNISVTGAPVMGPTVSFNFPNLPAGETPLPYMAVLQNNGFPFPITTQFGMPPPNKGGSQVPIMPYFNSNGSFYAPPMHAASQIQQQKSHSQPLVHAAHQNSNTPGGSSSQKQLQSQQLGTQLSGSSFINSTNMLPQPPPKQLMPPSHSAIKTEADTSAQNFVVPFQLMNFTLMPSVALAGCNGSNHAEKQQGSKDGTGVIPHHTFGLSFGSAPSGFNFSSIPQNSAIFQTLPDMAQHAYQIAPTVQVAKQKNFKVCEGKTASESNNATDGKKGILGKSPTNYMQTLGFPKPASSDLITVETTVCDGSARTLNFVSTPATGNCPTSSIMTSAAVVNPPNSQQQQQLLQIQKQHMIQQQKQQQPMVTAQVNLPTSNGFTSSSIAAKFPNNSPVFSQSLVQISTSSKSSHWKNSSGSPVLQVPCTPTTPPLKNLPQQQPRTSQGQTQISFGGNPNTIMVAKGHQSTAPSVVGSPSDFLISQSSGGNMKTASTGSQAAQIICASLPQQNENTSNGHGQKPAPVCGRSVPSLLSASASQLSELK